MKIVINSPDSGRPSTILFESGDVLVTPGVGDQEGLNTCLILDTVFEIYSRTVTYPISRNSEWRSDVSEVSGCYGSKPALRFYEQVVVIDLNASIAINSGTY